MAFVVDDGTGLTNANAYLSVAAFKAYHDDRGNSYSGSSDTVIEQSIVKATDYIDRRFKSTFIGYRLKVDQSLEWPRVSAFYPDGRNAIGIPIEVQQATAEYALRAITGALAPDPSYDDTNATVVARTEQVGPIRESYEFGMGGSTTSFRKYPMADRLLKELTIKGSYMLRV